MRISEYVNMMTSMNQINQLWSQPASQLSRISEVSQVSPLTQQRVPGDEVYGARVRELASVWRNMNRQLLDLRDKATALSSPSAFTGRAVTSSHTDIVTATASSEAAVGSHDVLVSQLAQAETIASKSYWDGATGLGLSGSFKINDKTETVATTDDLWDIAGKINNSGAGVTAAVMKSTDGAGTYRLAITSGRTGTSGTANLVDGSEGVLRSLGVMDANGNKAVVVNEAKDAKVSFDGQEYSSQSNTIAIQGLTLALLKASQDAGSSVGAGSVSGSNSGSGTGSIVGGSGTSGAGTGTAGGIKLTVTSNDDSVVGAVRAFVDSYNRALEDLGKYQTSVAFTDSAKVNRFRSDIVALAQQEVPELAPDRSQLSYIGLTFENGGKLDLDEAKLKERLANDRSAVSTLFTAPQGVAGRFDRLLGGLTQQGRSLIPEPDAAGVRQLVSDEFRKITGYLNAREAQLQSQAQVLQQTIAQMQRSQADPMAKLNSLFGPVQF